MVRSGRIAPTGETAMLWWIYRILGLTEWHPTASGMMARYTRNGWERRPATAAEQEDAFNASAW